MQVIKRAVLFCLLFFTGVPLMAQKLLEQYSPATLIDSLHKTGPNLVRVKLLWTVAAYYLYKPGEKKEDLDSALTLAQEGVELSESLHRPEWTNRLLTFKGSCYFEADSSEQAIACYMKAVANYHQAHDLHAEASAWYEFSNIYSSRFGDSHLQDKIGYLEHTRSLFREIGDSAGATRTFKKIADVNFYAGKLDLAETQLLQVVSQLKQQHDSSTYDAYYLLSVVSRQKGDLHKELFYAIETIKSMEASGDFSQAIVFYTSLAETYDELHMYPQNLEYFRKTLDVCINTKNIDYAYNTLQKITGILIQHKDIREAFRVLKSTVKRLPPSTAPHRKIILKCLGDCYNGMQDYARAEKSYLEMTALADSMAQVKGHYDEFYALDYLVISNFYSQQNEYDKAAPYVNKLLSLPTAHISPENISAIHLLKFRTDSAEGNYRSAVEHFQYYKQLNDSLFNATKSKQIQELEIKYETSEKDKNLQLQAQNIQLLKKQTLIERTQADKTRLTRNLMYLSSGMLLLLLGVGYNRYRLKQRSNVQLQAQQKEIAAKNNSLEQLLRDNEWLLKEVHHRVKNNLQIVMSLLNSQTAYLEDETALNAVKDSQHRVQAMSLIHQKLYKSDNVANIYMPEYINDLIDYLKDSFESKYRIYFEQQVDPIVLDTVKAVPLGLILNEIITNAMKYAFTNTTGNNKITVQLFISSPEEITLIVADNGRGLPADFDFEKINSFGIVLIKGLTEDLGGTFTIGNDHGTRVVMVFENKPLFKGGLQSVV